MANTEEKRTIIVDLRDKILDKILPLEAVTSDLFLLLAASSRITKEITIALLEQKKTNFKQLLTVLINNPNVELTWLFEKKQPAIDGDIIKLRSTFTEEELTKIWPNLEDFQAIAFLKHPGTPISFIEKISLDTQSISLLTAIAKHPNLPPQIVDYLLEKEYFREIISVTVKNQTLTVEQRKEHLENKKVSKRLLLVEFGKLTDDEMQKMAGDANPLVRTALAAYPELNEDIMEILLKDKNFRVRATILKNGHFSSDRFSALLENAQTDIRQLIYNNSYLPPNLALHLAVDQRVENLGEGTVRDVIGWIPKKPLEVAFCQGSIGATPNTEPGNKALFEEVCSWRFLNKYSKVFFVPEDNTSKKIQSFLLADSPTWMGDYFLFKTPMEEKWNLMLQGKRPGNWFVKTVKLPAATDGWLGMLALNSKVTLPSFIGGAIPGNARKGTYWLVALKATEPAPGSLLPSNTVLQKKSRTSGLNDATPIEAKHIISLIIQGGLFALWGNDDSILGWTQEDRNDLIPSTRQLYKKDLVPAIILRERLKVIEKASRQLIKRQITL